MSKTRAQAKMEQRKLQMQLMNQRIAKLRAVMDNPDNLADIPMFQKFNKNGIEAKNTYYQGCPEEYKEWVFDLTKRNMYELYDQTWGWNDKKKKSELYADWARYCILTVEDKPVGFINMKFEIEGGAFRLYIFEFQIEPEYQKKGLGKFLLQSAEFIALKRGVEAVMLTVFRINPAIHFYTKMKYTPNAKSPCVADPGNPTYDYEVLEKCLVKK